MTTWNYIDTLKKEKSYNNPSNVYILIIDLIWSSQCHGSPVTGEGEMEWEDQRPDSGGLFVYLFQITFSLFLFHSQVTPAAFYRSKTLNYLHSHLYKTFWEKCFLDGCSLNHSTRIFSNLLSFSNPFVADPLDSCKRW